MLWVDHVAVAGRVLLHNEARQNLRVQGSGFGAWGIWCPRLWFMIYGVGFTVPGQWNGYKIIARLGSKALELSSSLV